MSPVVLVSLRSSLGSKSPPSCASTHTGPLPSSTPNCAARFSCWSSLVFSVSPAFQVAVTLSS